MQEGTQQQQQEEEDIYYEDKEELEDFVRMQEEAGYMMKTRRSRGKEGFTEVHVGGQE